MNAIETNALSQASAVQPQPGSGQPAVLDEASVQLFEALLETETSADTAAQNGNEVLETEAEEPAESEEFLHTLSGAFWRLPMLAVEPQEEPSFKMGGDLAVGESTGTPAVLLADRQTEAVVQPIQLKEAAAEPMDDMQAAGNVEAEKMTEPAGTSEETPSFSEDGLSKSLEKQVTFATEDKNYEAQKTAAPSESKDTEKPQESKKDSPVQPAEMVAKSDNPTAQSVDETTETLPVIEERVVERVSVEDFDTESVPVPKEAGKIDAHDTLITNQSGIQTENTGTAPKTEQTAQTVNLAPVPKEELASVVGDFIVEQTHTPDASGQVTTRIVLTPEHLGEVEVKLEMTDNQLTAKIVVEHKETKQWLEQQLVPLTNKLAEQSIRVQQFQVDLTPMAEQSAQFGGEFQQRQQTGTPKKRSAYGYREEKRETMEEPEAKRTGRLSLLA